MSRDNLKNVLKRVFELVSGAGVTTPLREGAFAAGRPITLGMTGDEINALRVEAQLWCPLKTAPFDLVGCIHDGEAVPRKPPPSLKTDTSNGWLLNHPLVKVHKYCEHLDEVKEKGLKRTMDRLMGKDVEEEEEEQGEAERTRGGKNAKKGGAGRVAFEDFIVSDGEGEEAGKPSKVKAGKKYRPPPESVKRPAARAAADSDDEEEDKPLVKRPKAAARSTATIVLAGGSDAFAEGQVVEVLEAAWRGKGAADSPKAAWCRARIDNVNEETGTYDLAYEDERYEEDVGPTAIRRCL